MSTAPLFSPRSARLRSFLKDALLVLALIGFYVLMSAVVLPRFGFQT